MIYLECLIVFLIFLGGLILVGFYNKKDDWVDWAQERLPQKKNDRPGA